MLDTLDVTNVVADAEAWEKVVRKLRGGHDAAGRPAAARQAALRRLRRAGSNSSSIAPRPPSPNPGRTEPFHRLNRAEYQNAIRDLLALDIDVAALLPADDASYGFDNIAGVLKVSPTLLERYLSAAPEDQPARGRHAAARSERRHVSACRQTCRRTIASKACRSARAAARSSATRFRSTPST